LPLYDIKCGIASFHKIAFLIQANVAFSPALSFNQGSRFTPLNFSKKRSIANLTGVCPKTFFSSIINN
jgi:hypothetical protein